MLYIAIIYKNEYSMKKSKVVCFLVRKKDESTHVLMNYQQYHHTRKRWEPLETHIQQGESIERAAVRCVHEHAGLTNVAVQRFLGKATHELLRGGRRVTHWVLAYAPNDSIQKNSQTLKWLDIAEAKKRAQFEMDRLLLDEIG